MGGIPIVRRDLGYRAFYDLPICFIDRWDEVTKEFLEREKARINSQKWSNEKLKVKYWIDKINRSK
jgi:hypothetical protein